MANILTSAKSISHSYTKNIDNIAFHSVKTSPAHALRKSNDGSSSQERMKLQHEFMAEYKKNLMNRVTRTDVLQISHDNVEALSRSRDRERASALNELFNQKLEQRKQQLAEECKTSNITHNPYLE